MLPYIIYVGHKSEGKQSEEKSINQNKKNMIQTTMRQLKEGDFFTFRPHEYPKERQVYVRSHYDRGGKKFAYFPYSDMMDEHFAKGSRVVFTDFIF